jgi:hypothetical protein
MTTCVMTPYQLAFINDDADIANLGYSILDYVLNICFFIDIIINCCTAYYDDDYILIEDHWVSIYKST